MVVQSKHFLNAPESLVIESLEGLCTVNPHLALDSVNKVVYVASQDRSKVALLCGGGSGHEPSHSGFVGEGVLTAAVCGNVFASPSANQVRCAIDLVDNEKGTVIIVKNYTGDILNFGLAKENYAASHPVRSDNVKFVIVGDDVAVGKTQGSIVGRRGLAGTCLVYKIAGALAHREGSLDEVYNAAQLVSSRLGTIGVGLDHCHVPGTAMPNTHLGAHEIEIGLGIHNESGYKRVSPVPPLNELIASLLDMIISTTDPERSFLPFKANGKDNVVLLVNNLGGLSELELGAVVREARRALDAKGIVICRVLSGSFMTSLNMPGFSITLLLLPGHDEHPDISADLILSLLDDDANVPGWNWAPKSSPSVAVHQSAAAPEAETTNRQARLKAGEIGIFNASIQRACQALISAEPDITRMDNIAGDGDCGLTLKAGASAVLQELKRGNVSGNDVVGSALAVARVAEESMGGTSGALYSIFFSALARNLEKSESPVATPGVYCAALSGALETLYTYTRARPPSRTLVDPLSAFVHALPHGASRAVELAANAVEQTRDIEAKAGRSAYVEGERLTSEHVPDPGAWGVKIILEALLA